MEIICPPRKKLHMTNVGSGVSVYMYAYVSEGSRGREIYFFFFSHLHLSVNEFNDFAWEQVFKKGRN